jgi:hypothetical protein
MLHPPIPLILALLPSAAAAPEALPRGPEPPVVALAPSSAPLVGPVQAAKEFDLSYTYVEVGYSSTDIDTIDETTDAYRARGSLGLLELLYVFVDYTREDVEFEGGDADADSFGLGVGIHTELTSRIDLVGEGSYVYDSLNSDTVEDLDDSNSGWTAFAGGRALLVTTDRGGVELNGGFRWIDREAFFSEDEIGAWEVGGRFHFLNHLSVGATYQFLEDDSRWGADVRFSF